MDKRPSLPVKEAKLKGNLLHENYVKQILHCTEKIFSSHRNKTIWIFFPRKICWSLKDIKENVTLEIRLKSLCCVPKK